MASGFDDSLLGFAALGFAAQPVEDLDGLRAALASFLMDNTDLDMDNIYSLLFESGSKIIWH